MKKRQRVDHKISMQIGTVGALAMSVSSSVSIVIVNKYLISTLGFPYITFLTATHMAVTAMALRIASGAGFILPKLIDEKSLTRFAVINGISVGLLNLSLGFNSVGFYLMTKLAVIPCTVGIQQIYFRKTFSNKVKSSLATLLGCVAVATVTDVLLNFVGAFLSLLAIVTTCVSQIWTNTMLKEHGVNSTQLLYAASPYMSLVLAVVSLPLDWALIGGTLFTFQRYTSAIIFVAFLTCVFAVLVNFSTFLVIGKCDAVTYQVLGHLKTLLVLGFGFFVLGNSVNWQNVCGILIAITGMIAYGVAETAKKETNPRSNVE